MLYNSSLQPTTIIDKRPQVGVGVLIIKENQLLLGKRRSSHGSGCWGPPGGHLEFGETLEDCAKREVLEETGMHVTNITVGPITNDIFISEHKHYLSIFMIAQATQEIPQILEPEKCDEWRWFEFDKLPEPLFLPLNNLMQKYSISALLKSDI